MVNDSRFARYRDIIALVFVLGAIPLAVSVFVQFKTVEIDIPDKALSTIEGIVPADDFAMYVSADTVPRSVDDLRRFSLNIAVSETEVDGLPLSEALGIGGFGQGAGQIDYIQYNTLLISPRSDKAPPYVVEVVLK